MNKKIKVLQLCNVDTVAKCLLLPLTDYLIKNGYDVHITCSYEHYMEKLQKQGYKIKPIKLDRKIFSLSHMRSLWQMYTFIKKEKFDIVHVHTPIAAALGRVTAKLAGTPIIIYTAHGFSFHENMPPRQRKGHVLIEKILGRCCTDMLFTQSREDMLTAIAEKIMSEKNVIWISNGIDINKFTLPPDNKLKYALGFKDTDKIIGFTGRLIKEKGIEDLLVAMKNIRKIIPEAKLLVIGRTLDSDPHSFNKKLIKTLNLENAVVFAGWQDNIPKFLSIINVFTLPTYFHEGMPRSILEAMASGKPVVATNIRGCREEVVDGITGLLVPIKDPKALSRAIIKILSDPDLAHTMGQAGRKRIEKEFDEKKVLEKELKIYQQLINEKL
ncbi:glycosyltransferase family 4 protein [Patescibacteria group bacterium AH-259-L07]|nr:glycosyltransferase family 4 protein [Patescibacteria group bacterium AH-259-L07]